jgi:short-subunit dehydrogenase
MLNNKFSLKNQFSLITGAGGLLGEQHAIALLEVFSNLILTDIDYKKLVILKKKLEKIFLSSKIFIYKMDVTNEKSIMKIRNDLLERKIKLKVLINNASIDPNVKNNHKLSYGSLFESINIKNWNKQISVGLSGAMLCYKIFGSLMIKNKQGGVILNIASDLSVFSPDLSVTTGCGDLLYAFLLSLDNKLSFLIWFLFLLFGVSTAFAQSGLLPVLDDPTTLSVTQSSSG